ncbi:transposase, MuDR, MULE transposase domain protein [Tanacetum coccineum]
MPSASLTLRISDNSFGVPLDDLNCLCFYLTWVAAASCLCVADAVADAGVADFVNAPQQLLSCSDFILGMLMFIVSPLMYVVSFVLSRTNLVAVGMDGNNQIVPIAFGICKGETGPCWSWWMSVLKECIGDNPNLLFISDRHASIALAVRNEFPLAFHAVSEEFRSNMDILQTVQLDAYHKLMEVGPQRWSRAHCPLIRYNYMTSNSVESVNACSVLNRKLPIIMLTETYREMLQKWYFERREVAANMKHEITDWVTDKVHKRKLKSVLWVVNGIDQNLYQVYDGGYNREVNLIMESDVRRLNDKGIIALITSVSRLCASAAMY